MKKTLYRKVMNWFACHWSEYVFDPQVLGGETLVGKHSWSPGLHTYQEPCCHSPLYRNSLSLWGFLAAAWQFEASSLFTDLWLRSRDFGHSFVGLVVLFGSVSCWETHLHHSGFWKEKLIHDFAVHGPIHWPLDVVKFCCTFSSGCTFAFLSRGTWWMLQDFNTLLHNVLHFADAAHSDFLPNWNFPKC